MRRREPQLCVIPDKRIRTGCVCIASQPKFSLKFHHSFFQKSLLTRLYIRERDSGLVLLLILILQQPFHSLRIQPPLFVSF